MDSTSPSHAATVIPYCRPAPYSVPPNWTNVEVFGLRPETLPRFLVIVIIINVGISLAMGMVLIAVFCFFAESLLERFVMSGFFAVAMLGYAAVTTLLGIRKTRRQWQTYRLVIADQGLIQSVYPKPPTTILRSAVRGIIEGREAFLIDLGMSRFQVPKRAECPDRVRERLADWSPIAGKQSSAAFVSFLALGFLCPLVSFAALLIGLGSPNISVVSVCAVVAPAASIFLAIHVWRTRNHTLRTKMISLINTAVSLTVPLKLAWLLLHR